MRVHADARPGVHLDDDCAVLAERHRDVLRHHVDAGDVEADRGRRHLAGGHVVGMHLVGAVDRCATGGEVGRLAQEYLFALGGYGVERPAGDGEVGLSLLVRGEVREDLCMPHSSPWIVIGFLDQLPHAARSISYHARRTRSAQATALPLTTSTR